MDSLFREGSIGSILFKSQIISEKDITTALEVQKETGLRFGETLVSLGIVLQEDIDWALSHQLNIPYVRIHKESVDPAVLSLVPAAAARRFKLLPIVRIGDELSIAMADPLDKEAIAVVEKLSGCTVSVSMGLLREILEMQDHFYGAAAELDLLEFSSSSFSSPDMETIQNDGTGMKLLEFLLRHLVREGLSSLACKPLKEHVIISGRRGTSSRRLGTLSHAHYVRFLAMIKVKAGISKSSVLSSRALARFALEGEEIQVQVTLVEAGMSEYMTLKPVVQSPFPSNIATMHTADRNREVLCRLAALPGGIVLFSSIDAEERLRLMEACLQEHVGSGKEVLLVGRGFSQSGDHFPVLPADRRDPEMRRWITAATLHEPDVLAVEEIADVPAFAAAFDAVLQGKLLFGGLAVPNLRANLKHLFFLREKLPLLPLYLKGLVACRGIRILCPHCKKEDASPESRRSLLAVAPLPPLYRSNGCHCCCHTGYEGKRYLVEATMFDQELAEAFCGSETWREVQKHLSPQDFGGIVEEAGAMLRAGEITAEDYVRLSMENGACQWPE